MAAPTLTQVRETYRKHFKALKDSSSTWNATLNELVGPYDRNNADEVNLREKVMKHLYKVQRQVDLEEGDPYETAIHTAIEALKKDRVESAALAAYVSATEEIKADIRKKGPKVRKGPKEWSPRKRGMSEEEVEEALEEELYKGGFDLSLFIMFDDKGGLQDWTIEHPDYWRGHDGPVAQVPISAGIDYAEVRTAISEAFQSIDWDEVQKEFEEGEEADEE